MTPRLRPGAGDLLDAAAVGALGLLAFLGLRTTFDGPRYLIVAALALAAGLIAAHLVTGLRQPVFVLAAALVLVFFGLGGLVVLPDRTPLALDTLRDLAAVAVLGWKELLTTLPPVIDARLLVVPWLLGLAGAATGYTLARRLAPAPGVRAAALRAVAPTAAPAAMLALVILLGTDQPAARLADGVAFAAIALIWSSLRLRRAARRQTHRSAGRGAARLASGLAALALAGGTAVLVAPWLGAGGDRTVLRDYVLPPFDIGAYPSPLVGFRKYTRDANQLWDQELFTVLGLPDGEAVRIALLDDYDGSVWGNAGRTAGSGPRDGGFQRIGGTFGPADPRQTLRVSIAPAYAAAADLNPWLPGAGTASRIEFDGPRRDELADTLRVNLGSSSGLVTARLAAGDSYSVRTTVATVALPDNAQPAGRPALTEAAQQLLSSKVAAWTKGTTELSTQLRAVAESLRTNGAYTDGGPGEAQFLPGHSVGRLTGFFAANRPAGDDEQYAAAYALVASYLGIPARVVLGARPGPGGVVHGRDMHAWVEVHLTDGRWASIPQTEFMPDVSKKPDAKPPQTAQNTDTVAVPPPNAARQSTTTVDTSRVDPSNGGERGRGRPWWERLWQAVRPVVLYGGPPVLSVVLAAGSILLLKARRRGRRRTGGTPAGRFAGGWRELVDTARDLGADLPAGDTRQEESARLAGHDLGALAAAADAAVYGAGDPDGAQAAAYWTEIDRTRRRMLRAHGRWRRARTALSVRSLRPPTRRPLTMPPTGGPR